MDDREHTEPYGDAGVASAEGGLVFLDGPDNIAIVLSAQAAAETGRSLIKASEDALKQQREAEDAARKST